MSARLAPQTFTADIGVLNRQPGPGCNYVDQWWATDSHGEVLFFHRHRFYTPQCNSQREPVVHLWPETTVIQIPQVFVPSEFRSGVLTPYTDIPLEMD